MPRDWSETISGEELRQVQRGIDQTLRQTVAHKPYSPGEMPISATVSVVGAPTVVGGERGWVDARPLTTPLTGFAERTVGAMVDQAFPPGPAERLARMKTELRALSAEQRKQLLKECEASGDARAAELRRLAEEAWR